MSSIGSVQKLTLGVAASLVVGMAALVFSTAASANLPKKPACSEVSYSLVASAFSIDTPTGTIVDFAPRTTNNELSCTYYFVHFVPPGKTFDCGMINSCANGQPISGVWLDFQYPASESLYEKVSLLNIGPA